MASKLQNLLYYVLVNFTTKFVFLINGLLKSLDFETQGNHRIYPVFVRTSILAKKCFSKSKVKHEARPYCVQTTLSVLLVLFVFSLRIKAIIIIWYWITRYIQWLSEWWSVTNLILKGKSNTKHAAILYTYSTRCSTCCVCLFFPAQNYLMHVAKMISW